MPSASSTSQVRCGQARTRTNSDWEEKWRLEQSLRDLRREHQALTQDHARALADRDRLRERGLALAVEHGEQDRWEAAVNDYPDPYAVIWTEGPFAGFTTAKAIVFQDALVGHEVVVEGYYGETRGIFRRIVLPGERINIPKELGGWWNLEIDSSWRGRKCSSATSKQIGIGAIKRFEVVGPEFGFCEDCCMWVPKEDLMDLPYEDGTHRMCCRSMSADGECR